MYHQGSSLWLSGPAISGFTAAQQQDGTPGGQGALPVAGQLPLRPLTWRWRPGGHARWAGVPPLPVPQLWAWAAGN